MSDQTAKESQETLPKPWVAWLELTSSWHQSDGEKFLSCLLEHSPHIYAGTPGLVLGMDHTDKVLDALLLGTSGGRRKQIQHAFRTGLSNGNQSDIWSAALPAYRLAVEHSRTTLDPMLFSMRDLAMGIEESMLSRLPDLVDEGPEILAGVVLAGAVLWGDIRSPAHLDAIHRCSQFSFEGGILRAHLFWQEGATWAWCVPDGMQLLLHAFKDRHGLPMSAAVEKEKGAPLESKSVLRTLAAALGLPKQIRNALVDSPHRLSLGRNLTILPSYLVAYLQGLGTATPLDNQEWCRFLTGNGLPDERVPPQAQATTPACVDRDPSDGEGGEFENPTEEVPDESANRGEAVLNVLKVLAVHGSALTIQDAIKSLQALNATNWWPIEHILRDWAVDQLALAQRKRGAPSTLLKYFNALRAPLCAMVEDYDIRQADGQSLLELFDAVLGCAASPGARHFLTYRLKEFYRYCQDKFPDMARGVDFRELDNAVFNHQAAVRTAFPLEDDFRGATDRLIGKSNFVDLPERAQCSLLAGTLAYRCGLRKTEITNLRIMDIQDGNQPEIVVRASQWGRLKSAQAERRIPLRAFLEADELGRLRAFLSRRAEVALPSEALLTDHPEGRPLKGDTLFRSFLEALREASGGGGAHSLRHAFGNFTLIRFHIADGLECPEAIFALHGYRFKKNACLKMVTALLGREAGQPVKFQYLYALAKLLGHLSPQTTLRNYVHVLDLLVFLLRRRVQPEITVEQAAALAGVSNQRAYQILNRKGIGTRDADVGVFLRIMRERSGEFPPCTLENVAQGMNTPTIPRSEEELHELLVERQLLISSLLKPTL